MRFSRILVVTAASLAFSTLASAQLAPAPVRPAQPRPATVPRPGTAAPGQPATAPSPRAAACHNGMSFDRFLAELKQQAIAAGVSQRAHSEAAPYLVYDQSIVNRDRGH